MGRGSRGTRELTLVVLDDYEDEWLETLASPSERTSLLRFAASLPRNAPPPLDSEREDGARDAVLALQSRLEAGLQQRVLSLQSECASLRAEADLREERERERVREAEWRGREEERERGEERVRSAERERSDAEARLRDKSDACDAHLRAVSDLRSRIADLETPMGRGRAGETDVAAALRAAGFEVVDTSNGEAREKGFLDLLVERPARGGGGGSASSSSSSFRLAVECKNAACVDPKRDHSTFETKVRDGVARGIFDGACFVSLRAPCKRGTEVVAFETVPDARGRDLAPVTWIGTERGRSARPLTADQVEAAVLWQFEFFQACASVAGVIEEESRRVGRDGGERERGEARARGAVGRMMAEVKGALEDLARQQKIVRDAQEVVNSLRARCWRLLRGADEIGEEASFLRVSSCQEALFPWKPALEALLDEGLSSPDVPLGRLWTGTPTAAPHRSSVERIVGRETVATLLRDARRSATDAGGVRRVRKRERDEEVGDEEEDE